MENHLENTHSDWSMVIEAKSNYLGLNIRSLWEYRDLLVLLVRRDFVSFYKQTILGPLWFFIQPLFTTITFVFIFGNLAGLSTDGLPQPLFYMTGIVAWNYFADCLTKTSTVFRDNASIFGKVYFPRLIMPLSIVCSNLIKFGVQVVMLLIIFGYFYFFRDYVANVSLYIFLLPAFILLMASLALGFGMLISAMTTKYRDLSFLVSFGVQLLMYATPVIYPLSSAPEKYRILISLNPMTPIIEGLRLAFLGKGDFTWNSFAYAIFAALAVLLVGTLIFNRIEKNFVDTV